MSTTKSVVEDLIVVPGKKNTLHWWVTALINASSPRLKSWNSSTMKSVSCDHLRVLGRCPGAQEDQIGEDESVVELLQP